MYKYIKLLVKKLKRLRCINLYNVIVVTQSDTDWYITTYKTWA